MKKKRVSKRNKISWRKHVNIDDVEDFLEDQRLEERLGLKNRVDELFTLDTKSSNEVPLLSKKEISRRKIENPRCFQILKPHTNVPDPLIKRNRVRSKEERQNKLVKLKEEKRLANNQLKAKELDSIKGKELYEKEKAERPKRGQFSSDLWGTEKNETEKSEWICEEAVNHNLRQTGNYLRKVEPTILKKTTILPSVEPPHPGMSYNPSLEDHQDLLKNIADKEQELIKRDKHLNRVTRSILKKVPKSIQQNIWLEEMSQGLPVQNNEMKDNSVESEDDNEYKSINPPVVNKKKTLKQRKKQKKELLLKQMQNLAKIEKRKTTDIHRLKFLKQEVNKLNEKMVLNKEKKQKLSELKRKQTKRLTARKFEDKDLEFNMPNELTGTLRSMKKESNLLVDRFVSLQKRNIIVPTSRVQAKKPKVKRYVKPGFKDDWKTTVAGVK